METQVPSLVLLVDTLPFWSKEKVSDEPVGTQSLVLHPAVARLLDALECDLIFSLIVLVNRLVFLVVQGDVASMGDQYLALERLTSGVEHHEVVQVPQRQALPVSGGLQRVLVGDAAARCLLDLADDELGWLGRILLCRFIEIEKLEVKVLAICDDVKAEEMPVVVRQVEALTQLEVRVHLNFT